MVKLTTVRVALSCVIIFVWATTYSQHKCSQFSKEYIPKDLGDAIAVLDCKFTEKEKREFRTEEETDILGMNPMADFLRSRSDYWTGEHSLIKYFREFGIDDSHNMLQIILTSFHRRLNNIEIDLPGQINMSNLINDLLAEVALDDEKLSKDQFAQFEIGDSVRIKVEIAGDEVNPIGRTNTLSSKTACDLKGIVTDKFISQDHECTLDIALTYLCGLRMVILYGQRCHRGTVINYNLHFDNIEKL